MKVHQFSVAGGALLASLLVAGVAQAAGVEDLMKAKSCFACHATDKKLVGPSYKDVAAKYKGDKGAVTKLATKIQKGGSGAWGQVPMPANAVTDAEAKQMAEWILTRR
ncbi:c-type cytochrome [Chitinibacter bivalviorum]|uniref:C-type cytochrome n=1 Tax=Chitinibacter bivalviorum TaxID=2739434 RepID=A0A7H9BKB3_9NEIS|nr:c-type cytochrome [Chitinibacter bivalviorum]QLG88461.1 c-type cytochrome [Chitinibacter bivalviorum]